MTTEHSDLDTLLRADASHELGATDTALANQLIARLDTPPRRTRFAPIAVSGALALALIAGIAVISSNSRTTIQPESTGSTASASQSEVDPAVVLALDNATDDMLNPLRRELDALAVISRDSVRTFARFLPNPIGG